MKIQSTRLVDIRDKDKQQLVETAVPLYSRAPSKSKEAGTVSERTVLLSHEARPRENLVLKDLKPPYFSGEEKYRNRDAIYIFV